MVHQVKGAVIDVKLDMYLNLNVVPVILLAMTLTRSTELIAVNANVSTQKL